MGTHVEFYNEKKDVTVTIGMEYELVGDLLNVDQRCAAYDKLELITSAEFVHDTVITEAWSVEDY